MFSPLLSRLKAHLPLINAAQKGEWNTAGEGPIEPHNVGMFLRAVGSEFRLGRWNQAKQTPAHPDRIGGPITPRGLVVHTTDMYPGTFGIIVKRWCSERGKGNGAHFLIGRTPEDGIVQFVSIFYNGNHAGGPNCGRVVTPTRSYHPNSVYVGVEVDNAGALKGKGGKFYHPDTGRVIPAEDVYIDEKGRPWHKVTEYQMTVLKALWRDLYPVCTPFPKGTYIQTDASYESQGVSWAKPRYVNLVAHASLNPIQKTDPGPEIMTWMKS